MKLGKRYTKLHDGYQRDAVREWNALPPVQDYHKTSFKTDIKGLKSKDIVKESSREVKYKFTIGMEVEKKNFDRSAFTLSDFVGELPLFSGYVTDSTCGLEAVTHILPLLPPSSWRTKIFALMHDAERIIDDNYSPSNQSCGGHITIGVADMDEKQIYEAFRPNMGIMYALFWKRLRNGFCNSNLNGIHTYDEKIDHPCHNGDDSKYCPVKLRYGHSAIEFRLVSRFTSVKQMKDRYKLFYELADFSINSPYGRYSSFIKRIKPILMSMYNDDEQKVSEIIEMSKHFRKYLMNKGRVIPRDIAHIVDIDGRNSRRNRNHR